MHWRDESPVDSSGCKYDGKNLLDLVRSGKSPFDGVWDVNLLIREVEENLATKVTDIPIMTKGSNNYDFLMKTFNGPNLVARLARGDVNMPAFDGFPIDVQAPEAQFEVACYNLLRQQPKIRVSQLLYHCIPVLHPGPKLSVPQDLDGRRLFVFKESEGKTNTPNGRLYRFVLEHGDFGIHNTTIAKDESGQPLVTSLFDWETACIWPAILSDPLVAAGPVDLITTEDGSSDITRVPKEASTADLTKYQSWASHYIKKLYHDASDYQAAIQAGKDFRYLWYALRDWRGGNSEEFFGDLGAWAEKRIEEHENSWIEALESIYLLRCSLHTSGLQTRFVAVEQCLQY
ncbi:hypothetical protein FAUST_11284 [Fusarium austroamericanum]|uniref:Uncharacterized protein n=1 Tax=Fusarium austroamericanum TaxID=282268 RepID=A0AAN5YZ93_FUSAU|nr:hypothetical protein FAUST_11284 [Fusarium austroamericanum]